MIRILSVIVFISLTGCASLNSEYNCPAKKGIGCKSIHEVNQIVDEGAIAYSKEAKEHEIQPFKQFTQTKAIGLAPKRSFEKVLSILIAPFVDKSGNYHDASTVHTVIENSDWVRSQQGVD